MRLNKFLATRGYATRRGADTLISERRVFVNGKIAELGQKVTEDDAVEVKNFSVKDYTYVLYYKPRGVVTHSPLFNEIEITTLIKKEHNLSGLFPIGRMDKESEGLILLTNDGRVAEHSKTSGKGYVSVYEVTTDIRVTQTFLNALSKGVRIERLRTGTAHAVKNTRDEHSFTITLTETAKHQIRRMCTAFGYRVLSQKRLRFDTLELKRLRPGAVYTLKPNESKKFVATLGLLT